MNSGKNCVQHNALLKVCRVHNVHTLHTVVHAVVRCLVHGALHVAGQRRFVATSSAAPASSLVATLNFLSRQTFISSLSRQRILCHDKGGLVPCRDTVSMSRHKASLPCPYLVATLSMITTLCPKSPVATKNPLSRPRSPSPSPSPIATQGREFMRRARVALSCTRPSHPRMPVSRTQARSCA